MADNLPTNNPSDFLFPKSTLDEVTRPKVMFQRVQKRDGSLVDFDKSKIAGAIFAAAQSVGGKDRELSEHTADLVILYLARNYEDGLLNVEQIQDAVEKVLIENGHARTSKAFILYREKRAQIRRLKTIQTTSVDRIPNAQERPSLMEAPKVQTSSETTCGWNRHKIVEALVREARLDNEKAQDIALQVETQIILSKVKIVTVGLIRELVNAKLIEQGLYQEQQMHSRLGIPVYDTEQILRGLDKKEEFTSPETADSKLTQEIGRQYSLIRLYNQEIVAAHIKGQIKIHGLETPSRYLGAVLPIKYFVESGLRIAHRNLYLKPPVNFEEFSQMACQAGFQGEDYANESMDWPDFGILAGQFIKEESLDILIQGFKNLFFHLNGTPRNTLHRFHLSFPEESLAQTLKVYQSFMKACFMGDDIGSGFQKILPVIHLNTPVMSSTAWIEISDLIRKSLSEGRSVEIIFDSDSAKTTKLISGRISLNPELAAREAAGNPEVFNHKLKEQVQWAALAHSLKNKFLIQLGTSGNKGILSGYHQWLQGAGMNPQSESRFLIAVPDLGNTARIGSIQPEDYAQWTLELLTRLTVMIDEANWKTGIICELEPEFPNEYKWDGNSQKPITSSSPQTSSLWGPLTLEAMEDNEIKAFMDLFKDIFGEAGSIYLKNPDINRLIELEKKKGIYRIRLMP